MGGRKNPSHVQGRVRRPYCPFEKFCVFLGGESPESVIAQRDYLSQRVDELEFAMDFTNSQVKKLQERINELEEANSDLETELSEALKDPYKKYERKEPSENPKKRGAPFGHEGHYRPKPDHIDKTIDVYLDACPHCSREEISPCNHTSSHTQEDLEDGRPTVTLFIHYYYWCPDCKKIVHGWGEGEIPKAFIGPEARAKTTFLRHEIKTSYDDASQTLEHLCGLSVSPGAIVGFDNKFSEKGEPLYDALKDSLADTPFIHADETGWKRDWLWIFTNPEIAFFHIDESRGSQVVIDLLGTFYNGVLISDFYNAYRNKVGAFAKQKCLTHLLRDIKGLLDKGLPDAPDAETFLRELKKLLQDAIFLYRQHDNLTIDEFRSRKKEILKRFRKLRGNEPLSHNEADNLRKRLITHKNELFVFLKHPAVNPTNNFAEQGIRNAVLFRKTTFGNMTKRGQRNVSVIMTIIRTAKLRSLNPVDVLRRIMSEGVSSKILELFALPIAMPMAP